jgi:CheY-like chemotaxis protein
MNSEAPGVPGTTKVSIRSGADPAQWHGGGTLLVVDDDQAVRNVMQLLLERSGFTVLTAADGQSAVETLRRFTDQIRLVLLDLVLPDIDGEAVFRLMREICPGLKAILCSGYLVESDVAQRAGVGWATVIRKPFRADLLLQAVQTALES